MYRRGSKLNLCSCDFGVGVSKREGRRKHPRAYFPQPTAVWVHQFMVRHALSLLDDISWWIKWELSHSLSLVIWVFVLAYTYYYMCKNGEQDANDESWITADAFILMLRLQTPHLFPKHWRSWISNFQIGLYYLSISSSESSRTCQSQTNYSLIAGSFFELTYSMYIFSEEPEIAPSTLRLLSRRTHSICWVTQ